MRNKELFTLELELVQAELEKNNLTSAKRINLKDKELQLKLDLILIDMKLYTDIDEPCENYAI